MPKFYHFTSTFHLPLILKDGVLRTTESNVSYEIEDAGPRVVWFLDVPELGDAPHGLRGEYQAVDKSEVRFTVELPKSKVLRWAEFSRRYQQAEQARAAMIEAGGGPAAARRWWVTEAPVPRSRWRAVAVRRDEGWVDLGDADLDDIAEAPIDYEQVYLGGGRYDIRLRGEESSETNE